MLVKKIISSGKSLMKNFFHNQCKTKYNQCKTKYNQNLYVLGYKEKQVLVLDNKPALGMPFTQ